MTVGHPMSFLHSFSNKNTFYDKMDFRLFYFSWDDMMLYSKNNDNKLVTSFVGGCMYMYL